jgi:hypothetical protein
VRVSADIGDTDIVAHDDEDVGFVGCVALAYSQTKAKKQ